MSLKIVSLFRKRPFLYYNAISFKKSNLGIVPVVGNNYIRGFSNLESGNNKIANRMKKKPKEFMKFVKEEIFDIKSYKKSGKTYEKISKDKYEKIQKERENTTITTLVEIKPKLTLWQKWMGKTKETPVYCKYKGYQKQFERYSAENPAFKRIAEAKGMMTDKVEDIKDELETSQNPMVWKLRDSSDKLFAENNTSYALRKVTEIEPTFMTFDFMNELRLHIVPVLLQALFNSDEEFLQQTCDGKALFTIEQENKRCNNEKETIEGKLISIIDCDFKNAEMKKNQPVLNFTFAAHHLETITPKVPEGSDQKLPPRYSMRNMHYNFSFSPDRSCPIFGWKLVDLRLYQIISIDS